MSQKGHIYYRCHSASCPTATIREETVEAAVLAALEPLRFTQEERTYLDSRLAHLRAAWTGESRRLTASIQFRQEQVKGTLEKLTDALLDGLIDKSTYEERKATLCKEQGILREQLTVAGTETTCARISGILELAGTASDLYKRAAPPQRRDLLGTVTSNWRVESRNVRMTLAPPFAAFAERDNTNCGREYRSEPRILDTLLTTLIHHLTLHSDFQQLPPSLIALLRR